MQATIPKKAGGMLHANTWYFVTYGDFELSLFAGQALLCQKDLLLAPKEFALLHLLIQHKGEVVSQNELYEAVWNQPIPEKKMALKSCISRLRSKLAAQGYDVASVRGVGYRLVKHK